ncbi:MAG: hybrid sensor histidine kinase/response regulator [Hyphomonadaceae bacterium]|nr:hybrid sensor histidine kinase/response regulator [Hyphomonadaceae bacterium]
MLARAVDETGFFFVLDEPARLLVADGDPALRDFARAHLATPDVVLDTAATGPDALAALRAGGFDLVLIGLDLPVLDGCALIARIRADEALRHLPVVVVTGREDAAALDDAFQAGATSFVVKPLNPVLLRYQLRYVLRAWRQEREILQAKQRAEQAHAIKANVLRLVQHELRTPLTSIVGFAEHIVAHPRSGEVAEFAALIAEAGRRFTANVAELIAAAQLLTAEVRLRLDECSVTQILDAVVTAEGEAAEERHVVLRVHDASDGARLDCDRDLVVRALRHLVRNAIQHGEGPIDLMATRERGAILFAVRDRGTGIPKDRLDTCFEPFAQSCDALQRSAQGLGLGLPVARRVIDAHGGTLAVSHVDGVGCVAMATLPALPAETV